MTNMGILIICIACFLIIAMICRTIIYIHKFDNYTENKLNNVSDACKYFYEQWKKCDTNKHKEHDVTISFIDNLRALHIL